MKTILAHQDGREDPHDDAGAAAAAILREAGFNRVAGFDATRALTARGTEMNDQP